MNGKMLPVDTHPGSVGPAGTAGARCVVCGWLDELVLRGDVFVCRDPVVCAETARRSA